MVDTNDTDHYLAIMLEGYEKSLPNVEEFINTQEEQIKTAQGQREEILKNIAQLKGLLGLKEEEDE